MSFLGIDIGSSQVKAAAFDADGAVLASAYRKYAYATPRPGWMELDSRAVLDASFAVIEECARAVERVSPVCAVAASSQGEAFTAVSADGAILSSAMISGDSRAAGEIGEFVRRFGRDRLYRITGHTPSPMFTLAKLLWMKRNQPEIFRRSRYFLCFEDLLCHALTGRAAMGYPLAGRTMMFDVERHCWSGDILDAAGFDASAFADPLPSGTPAGTVLPETAKRLRLAPGTVWATGGHDQMVGALGCGVTEPGDAMFAAGSVECMVPILREKVFSPELCRANLCTCDFALPGRYATLAYSLTGSNMQEYFIREFCGGEYQTTLDAMPEGPTSLLALPYLTPSGTPWFDAVTPACVYGWRFDTARPALLKGLWEGIAFELRLNLEFLKKNEISVDRLIASGGGFRHPAVIQLHADILNLPIAVGPVRETGCRGAALLARRACEPGFPIPPVKIVSKIAPDPERAVRYAEKFQQWKNFSQTIRSFANADRVV